MAHICEQQHPVWEGDHVQPNLPLLHKDSGAPQSTAFKQGLLEFVDITAKGDTNDTRLLATAHRSQNGTPQVFIGKEFTALVNIHERGELLMDKAN